MVEVAAAIICKDNQFLICQRPEGKDCALLWEFPGGKLESNETAEQCLVRECHEELDITLLVSRKFTEVVYDYPERTIHLHFFVAKIKDGHPTKIEHNDFAWITSEEIQQYSFCPADNKMLLNNNIDDIFASL